MDNEDDALAAAQISQADIIECQAETIAQLKKQVKKAQEYKKLTNSKLKEAAARLKEYRLRVETLVRDEETMKQQLNVHVKASKRPKNLANSKEFAEMATQTDTTVHVTRSSQTISSTMRFVDRCVQTMDTSPSRKRSRLSMQTQDDKVVPKLWRHPFENAMKDTKFDREELCLPILEKNLTSSAALDEILAVDLTEEKVLHEHEIAKSSEEKIILAEIGAVELEIDKELESSSDEERLGTSMEGTADGIENEPLQSFDVAISSEIDQELAFSSDDEETKKLANEIESRRDMIKVAEKPQDVGLSIDDELDNELAALESEEEKGMPAKRDSSLSLSSSTSDSDSSSSCDSDEIGVCTDKLDDDLITTPSEEKTVDLERKNLVVSTCNQEIAIADLLSDPLELDTRTTTMSLKKDTNPVVSIEQSIVSMESLPVRASNDEVTPSGLNENATINELVHPRVAEPNNLVEPPKANMKDPPVDHFESTIQEIPRTRVRKTEDVDATSSKRVKRDDGEKAKKPLVATMDEQRIKKSLVVLKHAIAIGKDEEADSTYARRTLLVLVHQSIRYFDTHPDHVTALCHVLADTFQNLHVSPLAVVSGALGIFRTPRSRRFLQESKWGLSWLCSQVLLRLMRRSSQFPALSMVDDCLLHLQSLLLGERFQLGDSLSSNTSRISRSRQQSHDTVFLSHICALYSYLCKASSQLARARVLLFDLVVENPTLRGLYLTMVMLEVYPAMIVREFDHECIERRTLLQDTLLHVLVAISDAAAAGHELLLHQSSLTMLHRIGDAIQRPDLKEGNAPDRIVFVEKLWIACQAPNVDYFEMAKCLELCTAVYGPDVVMHSFSLQRCRELFTNGCREVKNGIVMVVGHLAHFSTAQQTNFSEEYIVSVLSWLMQLISFKSVDDLIKPEDQLQLVVACSSVCLSVILDHSSKAKLAKRRQVLAKIVQWMDTVPLEQLFDFPVQFLRRLRFAIVAARPVLGQ
ncbi:hypothetical protein CCR75_008745 [Bremia lactucae]|uniref:Uncharacterized protein n=1 Tax=Bremia lactucae TaxID=4779 RepID=A0A976IC44_BRELC|nr:hypothetical protein CCR75_008745 [Bremia lactucae]